MYAIQFILSTPYPLDKFLAFYYVSMYRYRYPNTKEKKDGNK